MLARPLRADRESHPHPEEVENSEEDFIGRAFKADPVLGSGDPVGLRARCAPCRPLWPASVCHRRESSGTVAQQLRQMHTAAALYATQNVTVERLVASTGKKLLIILSFGSGNIATNWRAGPDSIRVLWSGGDQALSGDRHADAFSREYRQSKTERLPFSSVSTTVHHTPAEIFSPPDDYDQIANALLAPSLIVPEVACENRQTVCHPLDDNPLRTGEFPGSELTK